MPHDFPPDDRLISIQQASISTGRGQSTLFRWIRDGLLRAYKKPGSRETHIDLAALPGAIRKAGRPGPKPNADRPD
jgi:hypothetical protein